MDAELKAGAHQYKNKQFDEFDRILLLPDGESKYERVDELHLNLLDFKRGLDFFANNNSFSQELRNELRIMAISVQLKINALVNKYNVEKSFFKPNINTGFTAGPTAAIASVPTTPPTAVPTISTPGGKRRKSRKHRTRQRKTRKSRR